MKAKLIWLSFVFVGLMSFAVAGQSLEKYIELKAEKYQEDGGEYVGVSPAVKLTATDNIGKFIMAHQRRFRYLLANNTKFQGLDKHYPDVVKMNKLYIDALKADEKFVADFNKLTSPAVSNQFKREVFQKEELMKVASRFFFCDTVKPDKSIGSHICIALNGLKEAQFSKDYTVLEAFCFEAIFLEIESKAPKRTIFVENFLKYIEDTSNKEKPMFTTSQSYLQTVRLAVFERMQADAELERILLEHFQNNKDNLPFEIKKN